MNRAAFTYMMSNKSHRIYIGATNDLIQRVRQHKQKVYPSAFTARYNFDRLVWYESWPTFEEALEREHAIKMWSRARKVALIQAENPNWLDLSDRWISALSF
jgi:putative endonuclease